MEIFFPEKEKICQKSASEKELFKTALFEIKRFLLEDTSLSRFSFYELIRENYRILEQVYIDPIEC